MIEMHNCATLSSLASGIGVKINRPKTHCVSSLAISRTQQPFKKALAEKGGFATSNAPHCTFGISSTYGLGPARKGSELLLIRVYLKNR